MPPDVTTGLVVVVVGGLVVVVVGGLVGVDAGTPGEAGGGTEVLGVVDGTDDPGAVVGAAGGAGDAAPGCSEATTVPIQAVAPLAPRTAAPVMNRMRACARSRARVACGRRSWRTDSVGREPRTRADDGLIGSCRRY